jgi:hypothetical protein
MLITLFISITFKVFINKSICRPLIALTGLLHILASPNVNKVELICPMYSLSMISQLQG